MERLPDGANELKDLREELNRVAAMMMNNAAAPATTPAGQPASSANAGQATEAIVPALDAPMPLMAEAANNGGAPATTAPAALPANDMWLRHMERATDRIAQWPQSPHTYMPDGRDTCPRSQRRTESPVCVRSGISAISE
eukprot:9333526-Pyramimonas_sp.AAC.1